MLTVLAVLRSGGIYDWHWVSALRRGLMRHLTLEHQLVVLHDSIRLPGGFTARASQERPLYNRWPGWWSKMEMFRPEHDDLGDFLFIDLDTVLISSLDWLADVDQLTVLSDFYKPYTRINSSFMFIPLEARAQIWNDWMIRGPEEMMRLYGTGGDQAFLTRYWIERARRWQNDFPGRVVSYKSHCIPGGPPDGAAAVCFHGLPKPTELRDKCPWIWKNFQS